MASIAKTGLDQAAMEALGEKLATALFPGAFIALYGDLGAGKTTLVSACAKALGIESVTSPTFTIVIEHEGKLPLLHFDAYRLADEDELYAIGFSDYLDRNAVIMMEWCENVPGALPQDRLDIAIEGSGDMPRDITVTAHGGAYEGILEALK